MIDHEIDSAFWKAWQRFRLPGGIEGFLLLHLPLLGVPYGLSAPARRSPAGLWGSLGPMETPFYFMAGGAGR